MFDHWAHLGGALFGYLYYTYGPQVWTWFRAINGGLPHSGSSVKNDLTGATLKEFADPLLIDELSHVPRLDDTSKHGTQHETMEFQVPSISP
jgi:hypothetical protein